MVTRKGLGQANTFRTNNNTSTGYGIVYADEVSGHRTVANLTALYALHDWQLSASGNNTDNDAIGQLWYVVNADGNGNGCYYQLKDWSKRKEAAGWSIADMEQNTEGLGIHKVYASYAAMVADASAPVGSNGKALRFGQLVVIYDSNNTTQAESGNVYAWQKGNTGAAAWLLTGNLSSVSALQSLIDSLQSSDESMKGKLTELDKDVNGINFSPVEVSGLCPWGNNLILALDGYTMVYIPVKAGETFHLNASCTEYVRIGFTTQTPVSNTPTTGYDSFKNTSKDYTPVANGYFCMGAITEITYEFSNPNPSLRQRVETLEGRDEILDELSGTTIDMADINVLPGAYNSTGGLSWAENGFYHSEPIKVTKGDIFKGLGLNTTASMALLASVSEDGTLISNLLMGSATSPQDFEYIFTSDGYISICGHDKQNTIRGIATIVTKGAIDKINELENEIETISPFYIKESANLVNGAIFTKNGRWNWDKTWLVDDTFRTSGKILVDSTKSLHIGGNINFITISQFDNVNSEKPSKVNDFTSSNLPTILSLNANTKAIEISVNKYNVGVAYVGYEAFSEYTRGFAPTIDFQGSNVTAVPAKLYDLQNTWKGKKYLSLGDSVSARNHWQQIVDFYLGTTHVNKAVSGTSIGTYAFNREGGGENTSDMEQAVATSLIPASELQSMDLIIIASYINSAVSLGTQADLGSMGDTFISISEEAASEASSIDAYASSIAGQNFTQAARSTIEYVLKNCGKAKVLIVGDLQFAGGGNYGDTNFEWVNNKGYNRRDFAKRMGEIAAYYGLPYVNLEECGGVNALNASEYYGDNIHPNFYPYYGGDNWTECGMKHEAMPIIKAMIGM